MQIDQVQNLSPGVEIDVFQSFANSSAERLKLREVGASVRLRLGAVFLLVLCRLKRDLLCWRARPAVCSGDLEDSASQAGQQPGFANIQGERKTTA